MLAELTARNALSRLNDPRLFREQAYIGGKWTAARDGKVMPVTNPATEAQLGVVPALGADETKAAIAAAAAAFPTWRKLLPQARAAYLRRWHELMIEARDDLALIMTLEQGKPLAEAAGRDRLCRKLPRLVRRGGQARLWRDDHEPSAGPAFGPRSRSALRPLITPWNFPSAMITRKAGGSARRRLPDGGQPGERDAIFGAGACRACRSAGFPSGRFLRRHRPGRAVVGRLSESPTCARSPSPARPRSAGSCSGRPRHGEADLDGTRRPRAVHRLPRRRPRGRRRRRGRGQVPTSGQDCLAANRIYVHAPSTIASSSAYAEAAARYGSATGSRRASISAP